MIFMLVFVQNTNTNAVFFLRKMSLSHPESFKNTKAKCRIRLTKNSDIPKKKQRFPFKIPKTLMYLSPEKFRILISIELPIPCVKMAENI